MKEKSLLLFETKEQTAQKYFDFLKETPWEIYHKQSIESFLQLLTDESFDLIIIEETMTPDDVISMLFELSTPVILSTNSENKSGKICISRDFSSAELLNAIGKVSFLKVVSKNAKGKESLIYSDDDNSDEDEPVLLEPVFEGSDEDAVILAPKKDEQVVRSSWEIPERKEPESDSAPKKKPEQKKDIFDRIDEIDSILTSLGKDLEPDVAKKPEFQFGDFNGTDESEKTMLKTEPFNADDTEKLDDEKSADFLFDDDYTYEEPPKDEASEKHDKVTNAFNKAMISDFEAIITDKPLNVSKVDDKEFEVESYEETVKIEVAPEKNEEARKEEIVKWLEKNGRQIIKEIVLEQLSKFSKKDG